MLHLGIYTKIHKLKKLAYNVVFRILPNKKIVSHRNKEKIIVSLSSYPDRFNIVDISIRTIMYQTVKPDGIMLNLNSKYEHIELPTNIDKLKKYGVSIKFCAEDIEPHRKYYYTMIDNPDAIIITIDDDLLYDPWLIKRLMKSYKKYPNVVSAARVHGIMADSTGKVKKYVDWSYEESKINTPSHSLLATGGGGTLYPPGIFSHYYPTVREIIQLSQFADDIMLKFIELKNNVKIVWVPSRRQHPFTIFNSQKTSLISHNKLDRNDKYINNLQSYYNIQLGNYAMNRIEENNS